MADKYVEDAIKELQDLRYRVEQFERDGTIAPGVKSIIVAALGHAIDLLIPF